MKVVVLFSGGMDSATCLFHVRGSGHHVLALNVHYGQRHQVECEHAKRFCKVNEFEYAEAFLPSTLFIGAASSQVGKYVDVPHGHYTDQTMKATVVPNRNMLLLATAGAFAISQSYEAVAYACHAGDHAIYPDCRAEFVQAMKLPFRLCDWQPLQLMTPFVDIDKAAIVRHAAEMNVPLQLTWSCYEGGTVHCGKCGTCVERREAFELAGVVDPSEYAN